MIYRVTDAWQASYDDPVRLRAGEAVVLSGREDLWDGHRWLWGRDPAGREGWLPDSLIEAGRALRDYSAMELSCRPGEVLDALEETHGWVLCRNASGAEGWVPRRCLTAG